MKRFLPLMLPIALAVQAAPPANPQINYDAFVRDVHSAGSVREQRRVSEAEFIRMAAEPGTVVLDARSERLYRLRHILGAVNLSFPEFTDATLAQAIPSRETRVLIYCNNNFSDLPESMPLKRIGAALNNSTFVALHTYGYRNVYELAPVVDPANTRLRFEGSEAAASGT
jgi:phage shock protein E